MNKCTFSKLLISRYIDCDCSEQERQSVHTHIASCSKCRGVYARYLAIGWLVKEARGSAPLQRAARNSSPARARIERFPLRRTAVRLAAALVLAITLGAALNRFVAFRQSPVPIVLETESSRVMNTPLGSLVYYQELAGKAVHSQFSRITTFDASAYGESGTGLRRFSGYASPLFCDSAILDLHASMIKGAVD